MVGLASVDVWGYEPGIVLRYAEMMAFTSGLDPDQALALTTLPKALTPGNSIFDLMRCRFAFKVENAVIAEDPQFAKGNNFAQAQELYVTAALMPLLQRGREARTSLAAAVE